MPDVVKKMGPVEDTIEIVGDTEDSTKVVLHIGTRLKPGMRLALIGFIKS